MSDQNKTMSDFRVGIVTFISLILLVAGITFAGGDKGLLFQKISTVKACLPDIGGLKRGSTVTMGGMSVGKVTKIIFNETAGDCLIEVTMEIRSDLRSKIKTDSVPTVRTQGMLGDRYIEIGMGSKEAGELPQAGVLLGKSAANFDEAMAEAKNALNETTKVLTAINGKEGSAGQFIYDEKFYEKLTDITVELNELIKDFKKNPKKYVNLSIF